MDSRHWIASFVALALAPGMLSVAAVRASAPGASGGTAGAAPAPAPSTIAHASGAPQESPFACDIMALDPAARKRHFDVLGPRLRALKQAVHELPDGYEFRLPGDPQTVSMVTEWAVGERHCCPFFDIEIRMGREGGPLWLKLTGREGTKEFIKVDAAVWLEP
jgi:hypothetical protein